MLPFNNSSEGIGFTNSGIGWIGGFGTMYETLNDGITWSPAMWGSRLNRFRMLNDTLGYASGGGVYKYTSEEITSSVEKKQQPLVYSLDQNYPNPFNPSTAIEFTLHQPTHVTLKIYDEAGREIETLLDSQELDQGRYRKIWNAKNLPSGVYYYRLQTSEIIESKKMILVK